MIVLHPHGPVHQSATANRPAFAGEADLAGLRVGIIDDGYGDDFYLETLQAMFAERYGSAVTKFDKPRLTAPSPPGLLEEAARSDAVVVGIGG